ncbi:MAG TPA: antibiotic biosynthesis monooxygenase family protein [Bryobacteraceae bacterium]|nr:antibiotic biosynthesis monooxygenase family protein [Bryobacteraceae bacterium]
MTAITLINSFDISVGLEQLFLQCWKQVNAYLQKKPGYLGHKLHRAITPDAPFRFVNIARWSSIAHFEAAHDAGFRELVDQPAWSAFQPNPNLYEVVHVAGDWHETVDSR